VIRIIVQTDDAQMAANVGGHVHTEHRTFDVDLPELEAFLREPHDQKWTYAHRQVIGVQLCAPAAPLGEGAKS
jgi:hypothetical protein